jgi:hypothetical protein
MRLLIPILWTLGCVALGYFLGTTDLSGRTAAEQAKRLWKHEGERRLSQASDLADDVKRKTMGLAKDLRPLDRHSPDEREAVDRLIANQQKRESK